MPKLLLYIYVVLCPTALAISAARGPVGAPGSSAEDGKGVSLLSVYPWGEWSCMTGSGNMMRSG